MTMRIARREIPGHSPQFRDAAGSVFGRRQMLRVAEAMARVGFHYLTDAAFRRNVRKDFLARPKQL